MDVFVAFFKDTYFQIGLCSGKSCSLPQRADPAAWLCVRIVALMTGHGGVITVQLGGLSVTAACVFSKGIGNLKRDQKIGFLFSLKLFPHVGNKKEQVWKSWNTGLEPRVTNSAVKGVRLATEQGLKEWGQAAYILNERENKWKKLLSDILSDRLTFATDQQASLNIIYIAEGTVLLRFQPWVTGSVLSGSWENGGGLVENTFLTSRFVGQIWLMSDGRNLEPRSQEKSKIERKF